MKKKFFLLTLSLGLAGATPLVQAASEDECAIWLCLPAGFGEGCGGAKSAFLDRVRHGKSPLPDFASCAIDSANSGGSQLTYESGKGAWLPERKVCVAYAHGHGDEWCTRYETRPAEFVKGQSCIDNNDTHYPPGCIGRRYIDVKIDGVTTGNTYYW